MDKFTDETDPRLPKRLGMDDPNTIWRYGAPPAYTVVNQTYLNEKKHNHATDSLERVVESLVKTFEMEASHKLDVKQWVSVDPDNFRYSVNGGPEYTADDILERGTYNVFLVNCPVYKETPREESEAKFKTAFPGGFAWEVVKVQAGPPEVAFTWRHWAKYNGSFDQFNATGETLEMFGSGVALVNDQLQLVNVQLYFDPNPMIMKLKHIPPQSMVDVRPPSEKA